MSVDCIMNYSDLQKELEKAKMTLVSLNDNIRKIVGRSPKASPKDARNEKHDGKRSNADKQSQDESVPKKKIFDSKSVFTRLSSPVPRNNDDVRPKLTSRVIRELPSRQEIVAAQGVDSESRARNRRIFGSLIGTLHKFCQEESRLKQNEDKKAKIEKKVEEQEKLQRENLRKEREKLFIDRKRKQMDIKRLELTMSRIKDYEMWENSVKNLKFFIKTKSSPNIYFRPKVMSKKTDKLLAESQKYLKTLITHRQELLKKDLADIEENFKIDDHIKEEVCERLPINIYSTNKSIDSENLNNVRSSSQNQKLKNTVVSTVITVNKDTDTDFKENSTDNSNERTLCSSIVVVNNCNNKSNISNKHL